MRNLLGLACAIAIAAPAALHAQQGPSPGLNVVMPHGRGTVHVVLGGAWKPGLLALYDGGTRPVLEMKNATSGLELSYILFANGSGAATAESCREDVIRPILKGLSSAATVKNVVRADGKTADGLHLATVSYLIAEIEGAALQQQNAFAFYGDKDLCAEVHVSKVKYTAADAPLIDAEFARFPLQPGYEATAIDYASLGSIFYNSMKNYESAAVYYDRALEVLPPAGKDAKQLEFQRYLTDQASIAYGISGNTKRSRALNEAAIVKDPEYPMYYYTLACADAEEHKAAAAREHLQQAFDRRVNVMKGEKMPDPTTDDSILKLKGDKEFWKFVEGLPKS